MTALIGALFLWSYTLNKGEVYIQTGGINYTINIDNKNYSCKHDPCIIKLKSGKYQLKFNQKDYQEIISDIEIRRWKTTTVKLEPKKIIDIKVSEESINEEQEDSPPFPPDIKEENIIASAWNKEGEMMVFLDKEDSKVKIAKNDGKIRVITVLKGITTPIRFYWSGDEKYILGNSEKDIYFIEIENGARKKLSLAFKATNITWNPGGDFILMNDKNNHLYKIEKVRYNDVMVLKNSIDLSKTVWKDSQTLIGYEIDGDQNKTIIFSYNSKTDERGKILEKYILPVTKIRISPSKETLYLYHETEKKWYEINLQ